MRHFLRLAAILGPVLVAWGGGFSASARADQNLDNLETLYQPAPELEANGEARHTFVFWINGDAEHFVTRSTVIDSSGSSRIYRSDAFEVQAIEALATRCRDCNVVILHDQRGRAHWYTADAPWATYLRVYRRGEKRLERHVDEIDETDPRTVSGLLSFSERQFPHSELHFIYGGHSFREPYRPGSGQIAPFDYSASEHGYDSDRFALSIRGAHLTHPLASIVLASCSMASLEIAARLRGLARYFVANELNVLEVLDVGFRFDAIAMVTGSMDARQISQAIAAHLTGASERAPHTDDAMMEYPTTWLDLSAMAQVSTNFNRLGEAIALLPAEARARLAGSLRPARLIQGPSDRYARVLRASTPTSAEFILQRLQTPADNAGDLDAGLLLLWLDIARDLTSPEIGMLAAQIRVTLEQNALVYHRTEANAKLGLSVTASPADARILPVLP